MSDLNKHMRTVHGTYRRRAKIPKETIGEIDDPMVELQPKIYGANPAVLSKNLEALQPAEGREAAKAKRPSKKAAATTDPAAKAGRQVAGGPGAGQRPAGRRSPSEAAAAGDRGSFKVEELDEKAVVSLKEELGLSSGITLQKIVRPRGGAKQPPPRLTYHGPAGGGGRAGPAGGGQQLLVEGLPRLVKMKEAAGPAEPPKMIRITGKFAKKMPDLVPLKKLHGQPKGS